MTGSGPPNAAATNETLFDAILSLGGRSAPAAACAPPPQAPPPVVELVDVGHTYPGPPAVVALEHIELAIPRGDYRAITGPSGAGKSTFLNIVGLLDRPTSGQVRVDGIDTTEMTESQRSSFRGRRLGFVFQAINLMPYRSVIENVMLAGIYARAPRLRRYRSAMSALELVGLGQRASSMPGQLSGGQQQRVAFARALAHEPSLLLCDEPTGNLDSARTREILALLGHLNDAGITILVVTHDSAVAASARHQTTIIDGRLT